jgi:hypothetical protein
MFRDKLSQVPPVPKDYNITTSFLRIVSPPPVVMVYNELTGGEGAYGSPSKGPAYLARAFCLFGFMPVVFPGCPVTLVRILGQAHSGHEKKAHHSYSPSLLSSFTFILP